MVFSVGLINRFVFIADHISCDNQLYILFCRQLFLCLYPWILFKCNSQVGYPTRRYCTLFLIYVFFSIVLSWILLDLRYTSFFAAAVGILLFLLTSFTDPGIIKAENVSQYLAAYPYDNIIFSEKECSTCKITKWVCC